MNRGETHDMRTTLASLLFVLLALPAFAQPVIQTIDPLEGFTYQATTVTITGSGFDAGAVEVFFDNVKATVVHVTSNSIRVVVPPQPQGAADVTVRVAGHGETKLTNAFFFHPDATGSRSDYMQVIVPLTSMPVHGSHGSVWNSELYVFNAGPQALRMPGPEAVLREIPVDPAVIVPPFSTERVFLNRRENSVDGAFLYVPVTLLHAAKFSLRVRDTSKNAANLGTEVPVARGDQGGVDITLFDIPVDLRYRATLRIYAFTAEPMTVGITVYPEDGTTPIESHVVQLKGIVTTQYEPFPAHPAYFAFDPLTPAVRGSDHERVRIELTNFGHNVSPPPPHIWGFVSITNNETQQVTTVTPK